MTIFEVILPHRMGLIAIGAIWAFQSAFIGLKLLTSNLKVAQIRPNRPLFLQSKQVLAVQDQKPFNKMLMSTYLNAWNINHFFLFLQIETDFRPIKAYLEMLKWPQLQSNPYLCGKITSKTVIYTESTFILPFKLELRLACHFLKTLI